ncbi:hypothetical protein PINS_up022198 [Pythium insidiosum]|nr:hypothetical protein PINS_up022198 [Pythium insidiosum]
MPSSAVPTIPVERERARSAASKSDAPSSRSRNRTLSSASSTYSSTSWCSADSNESVRRARRNEPGFVALEEQFCGWLWMRGSKYGRWRHRYFCLNGTLLSYYVTFPSEEFLRQASPENIQFSDGTTPRGVLRVAAVEEQDGNLGFRLYGHCGRCIEIRAHRVDERNEWLRVLKTPARRKTRSWSEGNVDELTLSLASFDGDMTCTWDRQSVAIAKCGWMLKRSDVLKRWNRYFFVLQGKMLSYYATDKPYAVPRRRGYIQNVSVPRGSSGSVTSSGSSCELAIKLEGNGPLLVRFQSSEELEEWREVLLAHSIGREAPSA